MSSSQGPGLEMMFEALFGISADGQWWRAPVPRVRMSFGQLSEPHARVQAASRTSEKVLSEVFCASTVNVRLTLWKNESSAFGGQLRSVSELHDLGLTDVIDLAGTGLRTIAYATLDNFNPNQIHELLLRIYRAEMGLEPSLQATIVIWRTEAPPVAVYIADDRGLDVITPESGFAHAISTQFDPYVYEVGP
jgi:hypothetical protein